MDCDFYVFSGHKIFGSYQASGYLYGKETILDSIPPYQGGGDMVDCVSFDKTTYNILPFQFEAGTSNFIGAICLGKALEYINSIGVEAIAEYERDSCNTPSRSSGSFEKNRIYGNAKN